MLQELESMTILHEHVYVLTFKATVINFHDLLDCLQDVRFRNLKFPFPYSTLHLYSASCSKTEVRRQQNNTNAGTARFQKER